MRFLVLVALVATPAVASSIGVIPWRWALFGTGVLLVCFPWKRLWAALCWWLVDGKP